MWALQVIKGGKQATKKKKKLKTWKTDDQQL